MFADVDPALDVRFRREEHLGAAVVDGAVEEGFDGDAEGGGACARHAGADDLEFLARDGLGWCLTHGGRGGGEAEWVVRSREVVFSWSTTCKGVYVVGY